MAMRIATIDLGTNSVLLLVTEWSYGQVTPLVERATVTKLGEGIDRTGQISEEAAERALTCLSAYKREIGSLGVQHVIISGTSAVRDASNADAFLKRVEQLFGIRPLVLSGQQEAELTFLGALQDIPLRGAVVVVDIGGGSTEVVLGQWDGETPTIQQSVSVNIGSVRLTERHLTTDPPTLQERALVQQDTVKALAEIRSWATGAPVVAVAGTATTLAAVAGNLEAADRARVHNFSLSRHELGRVVSQLTLLPCAERAKVAGVLPARAGVIVAGGLILEAVMDLLATSHLVISDRGLRWGIARWKWNALSSGRVGLPGP